MHDDHISAASRVSRRGSMARRRLCRAILFLGCAVSVAACEDERRIAGPPPAEFPAMLVSDPAGGPAAGIGAAAAVGAFTFVSLPPGAIPDGLTATITNRRTGDNLTIHLVNGGFDPLPLEAVAGDVLDVVVSVSGSTAMRFSTVVPLRTRPRVVRTEPPPRKRDVPLNRMPVVVFSEPIDASVVSNGGIQLRRGGQLVPGRVELSSSTLSATFIPADSLNASSDYELAVGEAVRDLDGDALESPVMVEFTTVAPPAPPPPPLQATRISAGHEHSCALDLSGAAFCWGSNSMGQLGNGSTTTSSTPVAVSGGLIFTAIAAGWNHTCGLTNLGVALCWGWNANGALGDGSTTNSSVPVAVGAPYSFISIASGYGHTCGLTNSGAAYCWGVNDESQLGNGLAPSGWGYGQYSMSPVAVLGGHRFTALAAGDGHTCGLDSSGAAWCWGVNNYGQLGIGPGTFSSAPARVLGGLTFTAIVTGARHTCGLRINGAAYCWGANDYAGQLGDGSRTNRATPVAVSGGLTFSWLVAGGSHTCGIASSGLSFCWGYNNDGQLGNGSQATTAVPIAVNGNQRFTALGAGDSNTCGLTGTAAVYCWGNNHLGQVGNGQRPWVPAVVSGLSSASVVQAGTNHSCALDASGAAFCWGDNAFGQLGTSSTTRTATPVAVASGLRFGKLSSQRHHTCGLTSGGAAYCWGLNQFGALGDGSTTNRSEPVAVSGGLSFSAIDVGSYHTCGIVSTGAAYCWGSGASGELGAALFPGSSTVPVVVSGGTRYVAIVAGAGHSCGLSDLGTAYCWGNGAWGQLGGGSTGTQWTPVAVSGGLAFSALTAGLHHTCGLTSSGPAYCWGTGWYGELGNGQIERNHAQPVSVFGGQRFDALSAGYSFTCGLATLGAALCWGSNWQSQLGNGAFTNSTMPVSVSAGTRFQSLTTGEYHACGLTISGTVQCWGENYYGQLGRGRYGYEPVPVAVGPFTGSTSAAVPSEPAMALRATAPLRGPACTQRFSHIPSHDVVGALRCWPR